MINCEMQCYKKSPIFILADQKIHDEIHDTRQHQKFPKIKKCFRGK